MNKEELHESLKDCNHTIAISVNDIVNIYGTDKTRKIKGTYQSRADILARVYNLKVTKEGDTYTFTK